MATLQVRLQDLATRIATECKALRTLLNGNAADLSALNTTAKNNIVAAINELVADIADLVANSGAIIDDTAAATDKVFSSSKTMTEIIDAAAAVKAEILGGAGSAYDTLAELQALLEDSDDAITSITTALSHRVRTDTNAQGLTSGEKLNARTNIDAYGSVELGNPDANLVATFETGLT